MRLVGFHKFSKLNRVLTASSLKEARDNDVHGHQPLPVPNAIKFLHKQLVYSAGASQLIASGRWVHKAPEVSKRTSRILNSYFTSSGCVFVIRFQSLCSYPIVVYALLHQD